MNKLLSSSSLESCKVATSTLLKVVANIINNPNEDKYRSIKKSNAVFAKKVTSLPGGIDVLLSLGFSSGPEEYVLYPSEDAWNVLVSCKLKLETFLSKLESLPATGEYASSSSGSDSMSGGGGGGGGAAPLAPTLGATSTSSNPSLDASQLIIQQFLRMGGLGLGGQQASISGNKPVIPSNDTSLNSGSLVVEIRDNNHWDQVFARARAENCHIICDFYADWCGPCRKVAPVLAQLSIAKRDYKVIFIKVNVDNCRDIAERNSIRSMPTFILYTSDGQKASTMIGFSGSTAAAIEEFANRAGRK